MKKKLLRFKRGLTLVELLVASVVGGFVTIAAFSGIISMQRCLAGAKSFADSTFNQTRLGDFLALDLRRALTVTKGTDGIILLKVTIPDFYDESGKPRTPVITKYVATYGDPAKPVEIVYYREGTSVFRREGAEDPVEIAEDVADFKVEVYPVEQIVETTVSFTTNFQRSGVDPSAEKPRTVVHCATFVRNKRKDIP